MRPSERPFDEIELDLDELGITRADLVADAEDAAKGDPELKGQLDRALTFDAEFRIAVRYFWDEGHPQPSERSEWAGTIGGGRTPDWRQLPPWRDDDDSVTGDARVRAPRRRPGPDPTPFDRKTFQLALRMLGDGVNKTQIASKTGISRQRVDQIEKWRLNPGREYEQVLGQDSDVVTLRRV